MSAFIELFSHNEISQLALDLLLVILVTGVLKLIKQPLIIGYILAGVLAGPMIFDLFGGHGTEEGHHFVELFSHLGIALLLFMVGLGLDAKHVQEHGKTALVVGGVQIIGTMAVTRGVSSLLGYDMLTSAYIAAALTFSSTIVIVKLLSDKEDEESVYGRVSIGLLIVQDIIVMITLMAASIGGNAGETMNIRPMLLTGVGLVGFVYITSKYIFPKILGRLAQTPEYLLLIGIGRCLLLGTFFEVSGFSFEIGCLLAGMSFASSPFRTEMAFKLKSLRDFFIVLFFLNLGSQLDLTGLENYIGDIIAFFVIVMIVKPALVYIATRKLGFTPKTALMSSMSIAQISEFSFLLIGIGVGLGHLTDTGLVSVMTLIGLVTILLSSYLTMYNDALARRVFPYSDTDDIHTHDADHLVDVMLFGYGRIGSEIGKMLSRKKISYIKIDHDPAVIKKLERKNIPYVFADAANLDAYKSYLGAHTEMVISTMRHMDDDIYLTQLIKKNHPHVIVLLVCSHLEDAKKLYEAGADYVIMPEYLSARHASTLIEELGFDIENWIENKVVHRI